MPSSAFIAAAIARTVQAVREDRVVTASDSGQLCSSGHQPHAVGRPAMHDLVASLRTVCIAAQQHVGERDDW